jgi:hypothetical protein
MTLRKLKFTYKPANKFKKTHAKTPYKIIINNKKKQILLPFYRCITPNHHHWMYNKLCKIIKKYPTYDNNHFLIASMYKTNFLYTGFYCIYSSWKYEMSVKKISYLRKENEWYAIALCDPDDDNQECTFERNFWNECISYHKCACNNGDTPKLLSIVEKLKKIRLRNIFIKQWITFINLPETVDWFYQPGGIGYKWTNNKFNKIAHQLKPS